jgi:hypothetical protein
LPLIFLAKTDDLTIVGNKNAWLDLKELQDSEKIEIVPYQGVKTWLRSL